MRSEALNAKARGRKDAKVVGEISPASLRLCGFALVLKELFKFAESERSEQAIKANQRGLGFDS